MTHPLFRALRKKTLIHTVGVLCWAFLISLVIIRIYFNPGTPITHDGENHLARFANYKVALKEGQFPPQFAPNLYHRLGYPVFLYNYPLANILSLPFSLVKLPYYTTFKILMSVSLISAVLALWIWLTQLKFSTLSKLGGTLVFMTTPYLFQTVIFRGSIGEVMALSLFLWIVVWIENLRSQEAPLQKSLRERLTLSPMTIVGGALFGLFFLAHNVTVLFGNPVLLLYAVWRRRDRHGLASVGAAFALGIGLSLWFWLPALMEQSAIIVGSSSLAQQYQSHFATLQQLISSPVQFGYSYLGHVDSLSFTLGLAQWFVVLCAAWLCLIIWRRNSPAPVVSVLLAATVLSIVLQLSITAPVWQLVPLARYIQFPWRLSLFTSIGLTAITAWVIQQNISWQRLTLFTLLLIQVILLTQLTPVGYIRKERIEYELFEQSTTTSNENLPKDFTLQEFPEWKAAPTIESGEAKVTVNSWNGTRRSYQLDAHTPVTIVEPTMYFPGWKTTSTGSSNGAMSVIPYINSETIKGSIAYQLQPGQYTVQTSFSQPTLPRMIGNSVTLVTLLLMILHLACRKLLYDKTRS